MSDLSSIKSYISDQDKIKSLLPKVEEYVGSPLDPSFTVAIMKIYTELSFTEDRILALVQYCCKKTPKYNSNYLLKVANTWKEKNIFCAEDYDKLPPFAHEELVKAIFDVFNLSRQPYDKELAYITKWVEEWGMENTLILDMCRKTIKAINKPSFPYLDQILLSLKTRGF